MAASAAAASLGLFSVARAAENGVTDTEVVLGHTGILSGPLGAPIKVVMAGAGLAFDAVNAQGGVFGPFQDARLQLMGEISHVPVKDGET